MSRCCRSGSSSGRAFTGVQLAAFAISASAFALFLYITLYFQNYLGYSPLQAGIRYLPITVVSFFVAPISGLLLSRVPARILMSRASPLRARTAPDVRAERG